MSPRSADARRLAKIAAEAVGAADHTPTGFIVWLFRHAGLELEEDLVAVWNAGASVVGSELDPADVVFRTGEPKRLLPTKRYAGHLGVYVDGKTRDIVHVSPKTGRVERLHIDAFLEGDDSFRGTRRPIAGS